MLKLTVWKYESWTICIVLFICRCSFSRLFANRNDVIEIYKLLLLHNKRNNGLWWNINTSMTQNRMGKTCKVCGYNVHILGCHLYSRYIILDAPLSWYGEVSTEPIPNAEETLTISQPSRRLLSLLQVVLDWRLQIESLEWKQ